MKSKATRYLLTILGLTLIMLCTISFTVGHIPRVYIVLGLFGLYCVTYKIIVVLAVYVTGIVPRDLYGNPVESDAGHPVRTFLRWLRFVDDVQTYRQGDATETDAPITEDTVLTDRMEVIFPGQELWRPIGSREDTVLTNRMEAMFPGQKLWGPVVGWKGLTVREALEQCTHDSFRVRYAGNGDITDVEKNTNVKKLVKCDNVCCVGEPCTCGEVCQEVHDTAMDCGRARDKTALTSTVTASLSKPVVHGFGHNPPHTGPGAHITQGNGLCKEVGVLTDCVSDITCPACRDILRNTGMGITPWIEEQWTGRRQ